MDFATSGGSPMPLFAVAAGDKETWVDFYAIDEDGVLGPCKNMAGVNLNAKAIRGRSRCLPTPTPTSTS